ncbi:uncharacterized protein LOC133830616 isoform X4 [Humulus lupulus]|uniref:uncharacterized protein LOC133830616 isoform X4 n=1 Tax=Humulus lupulus TaxID=3486 RepID=UPI002B40CCF4|nr:uncharacterized protein LOC133830616 isoform X4 [Humulus lupulus]
MEITDDQRKRAEANRLAALAKRKALIESSNGQQQQNRPSTLAKCPKLSHQPHELVRTDPISNTHLPEKFRVRLEVCSPDSFSITPLKLGGFDYPGEEECLRRLADCLSMVISSHYTQNHGGGKACVYKVRDYGAVLKCLKSSKNVEVEEIPWATFNVVERLSHSLERWMPCRPEHFSDEKVNELIGKLPKTLLEALLPFQLDGIKFGLQRGGRCLIADEMGLGKTLQAIAIACCLMDEGSVLVVCPAILRFSWAEELEHWVPFLLPSDIHLVFGHQNNPVLLKRFPKVVVISYTMLYRLRKSMLEREWALLVVDESHHVRCTKKAEPGETKAVLDMATKVKHVVLLSGTPSLSRPFDIFHQINMLWPGMLGKNKFEFGKTYCDAKFIHGLDGKIFQDFSKGTRLEELNVLLKQTVMEFICEKRIGFVRIDGTTLARDRQSAVLSFRSSTEVKIAIIGITAGGVGLDFSSAQHLVFLELPQSPSLMLQAEDRAHRRGQKNAVNIYIFCAKVIVYFNMGDVQAYFSLTSYVMGISTLQDTLDESHWKYLNQSLRRVSSTTDGKYDSIQEIEVEGVSFLETCTMDIPKDTDQLSACTLELRDTALAKDTEPSEEYNEFVNKTSSEDKSDVEFTSVKANTSLVEAIVTSGVNIDKHRLILEGKLEEKYLESKIGKADGYSSKLDEGNISPLVAEGNESVEADECCSNIVNSLRFEVSQYTGRIHLYSCLSGTDSRPRPLFENFRPEELEPLDSSVANNDNRRTSIMDNPVCRNAVLEFSKEWNNLRPVERKKLIGKPLQLPLTVELCFLNESINHNTGGLIKVGSKRRHTPMCEISQALPPNAVWKKVYLRSGNGKKEKEYTQGWMVNEPLCKLCQAPCKSCNAKEPEFFEDLFCDLECYEEYRIRTSNRSLRQELFQLENGICTNCHLDCHKLVVYIRPLSLAKRREYIEKVAPKIASREKLLEKLIKDPTEGNAWHADHIVPVYRGGGECKLENMRTLCIACHSDVTKAQCAERRSTRARAKKQLKAIMNGLKDVQNNEQTEANDQGISKILKNVFEDELLVKVPGSAYSSGNNMDAGSEGPSTNKEIYASTNSIY